MTYIVLVETLSPTLLRSLAILHRVLAQSVVLNPLVPKLFYNLP